MATPKQMAWAKIKKNKPALAGLVFLCACIVVAILGYTITPDQSPDANEQMIDVQLRSPGFSCKIIPVKKNRHISKVSWLKKMMNGQTASFLPIPVVEYEIKEDSIVFKRPESLEFESLHLADVHYSLDYSGKAITKNEENFTVKTNGKALVQQTTQGELAKAVEASIYHRTFYLGTDVFGRDLLSRLLIGLRISLFVGLIAVIISITIGVLIGSFAGYFGGKIDDLLMLLINTVWSIPTLLLVFAIVLTLGKGVSNIFIAVGLTMWVEVARIVRGQVMGFRNQSFVEAAETMGYSNLRIILKHILPNIIGPLLVIAAANFATAILIEAGLSYLGFGIEPPQPSWGTMLNENYGYALSGKPLIALVPALAILLLVLSFNLVGNGLRDAFSEK